MPLHRHADSPTTETVWYIHTWGVNCTDIRDVDYAYVYREEKFQISRYCELLDILFETITLGVDHIQKKTKRPVVLRLSGIGMGVWLPRVSTDAQQCWDAYNDRLKKLSEKQNLEVLHPKFPHMKTVRVESTHDAKEWKTVEDHDDLFGFSEASGFKTHSLEGKTLVVVNAWDNGSWVGNGGSGNSTMDGFVVAGGSPKFPPSRTNRGTVGYQFQTAAYLHNPFFHPTRMLSDNWVRGQRPRSRSRSTSRSRSKTRSKPRSKTR